MHNVPKKSTVFDKYVEKCIILIGTHVNFAVYNDYSFGDLVSKLRPCKL